MLYVIISAKTHYIPPKLSFSALAQSLILYDQKKEENMNTLMKKDNGNVPTTTFSGLFDQFFQNSIDRFFDDDFLLTGNRLDKVGSIPANVKETNTGFELELSAPGLKKEDFKIGVENDELRISFEHKENTESKNEGWLRCEFKKQSFYRAFKLGESVDTSKISASYTDGILKLTMPKKEGSQKLIRTIEIQ